MGATLVPSAACDAFPPRTSVTTDLCTSHGGAAGEVLATCRLLAGILCGGLTGGGRREAELPPGHPALPSPAGTGHSQIPNLLASSMETFLPSLENKTILTICLKPFSSSLPLSETYCHYCPFSPSSSFSTSCPSSSSSPFIPLHSQPILLTPTGIQGGWALPTTCSWGEEGAVVPET